ncbi:MAG: hypothetical protein JXB07_09935 [Anaerolineae bacterium]|nr:hypothetical protein [Anaerolineae bacterium]
MTESQQSKPKRRRVLLYVLLGLLGLCVTILGISALSNRFLPTAPTQLGRLTEADQARIAEAFHLKEELGSQVWPGWGDADIPVIVWNSQYAFLYGYSQQPEGWEAFEGEMFNGWPVYRQSGVEHQAFTEQMVDDTWAGSMSTKWEVDAFMMSTFRDIIPVPINTVVPYRLFILPSEQYMAGVLHETFHAYQATTARSRFDDAELAYPDADRYWAADETMHDAWANEINLLISAMEASTDVETARLARQFLEQRAKRRADAGLDSALIDFERRYEWLEGLAKTVELDIWQTASEAADYRPLPDMSTDPDFQHYRTFGQRWASEMITMRNCAGDASNVRFYYTGMAQARLLDRLLPGWKEHVMQEGIWLEALLAKALE